MDEFCRNCGRPLAPGEECHCTDEPPELPVYAAPKAPDPAAEEGAGAFGASPEGSGAPKTETQPQQPPKAPPAGIQPPPCIYRQNAYYDINRMNPPSDKSRTVAALLAFFLGCLGVHRFYAGRVGLGLLWLFTFGLCGVGALVDFIIILCGKFKDQYGRPIVRW